MRQTGERESGVSERVTRTRGRPGPRPDSRRDVWLARRAEIVEMAARLIQDKGYHRTTLQDLADALGFSKTALYHYVPNKEALLYLVVEQAMTDTTARVRQIVESAESPPTQLRQILDTYLRLIVERSEVFAVFFQEKSQLSPAHQAAISQRERDLLRLMEAVYREGVAAGQFAPLDPTVAVFGLIGLCSWVYRWYDPAGRLSLAELTATFHRLMERGYQLPARE